MAADETATVEPVLQPPLPLALCTAEHCFDVQFHPEQPLLAAATITGTIELHKFDADAGTSEPLRNLSSHKDSCRTARFLLAGDAAGGHIASASASCFTAVTDVESGKKMWKAKLAAGGNALLPLEPHRFVVGDDDGHVAVYDVRKKRPVVEWAENEDFITDFALGSDNLSLCATSGDGTLAVYDLRKAGEKGLIAMSDFQEDEFLSMTIVRDGSKVLCGSQTGVLCIFSWGDFGDMNDRIRGHPMSVDAMVKLDEDCVLTGSSDGRIRVVSVFHHIHKNNIIGFLGEHGDSPIERLALSPDKTLVASASHEQPAIRIWSTEEAYKLRSRRPRGGAPSAAADDGDGDSDDSDDEPQPKKKRKGKRRAPMANAATSAAKGFFSGL